MVPLNEELERHVHIKAGSITLFVCHKIQAPGSTKAGLTGTENMNQNVMNNWGYSFCFLMARRGPLSMHLSTKSASTIFFLDGKQISPKRHSCPGFLITFLLNS